jgi:hypothetical protein
MLAWQKSLRQLQCILLHAGTNFHATDRTTIRYAGMKGGTVLNPINALAKLLAGMVDDDHHITVEGFYE